jgi:hypothetical protein
MYIDKNSIAKIYVVIIHKYVTYLIVKISV